jgi:hypothetical protein
MSQQYILYRFSNLRITDKLILVLVLRLLHQVTNSTSKVIVGYLLAVTLLVALAVILYSSCLQRITFTE